MMMFKRLLLLMNRNMATNEELSTELMKLKKEFLIEIILTRKIQMYDAVKQKMRGFIKNNE